MTLALDRARPIGSLAFAVGPSVRVHPSHRQSERVLPERELTHLPITLDDELTSIVNYTCLWPLIA